MLQVAFEPLGACCACRTQVPRLYGMYKEKGLLGSFQELFDNRFVPRLV